jgi:hypothetical protein
MKFRPLPALLITAALISAALTGCFQELPLGDKYINEAVGHLRVQNTSTGASYVFTGLELRNEAGEVIKTWDGLDLKRGGIWTGDVDKEGSFLLYCTVWNEDEQAAGRYEYGTVAIKLHAVTESKIMGEAFFSDADGDGFSDSWERAYGFDPENNADGGPVYVSSSAENDNGQGTAASPYKTLAKGVWKAKYGLTNQARTVMVAGILTRQHGNAGSDTSVFYIADTGAGGVTISGNPAAVIDAESSYSKSWKRALYLGPGTKLTLKNITITKGFAFWGAGVHADGAELILGSGAKIQGCTSSGGPTSGAAIYASDGAAIIMENGSLIGGDEGERNIASRGEGGAIGLYGSSLTMKNGSLIKGNRSNWGGAVSADQRSLVTLEQGALITGNTSNLNDHDSGSVNHGGGVRLTRESKLLMTGGLITLNIVQKGGGGAGVYVGPGAVLDLRSGAISENKTEGQITIGSNAVKGNGGGVYVDTDGVFLMSGGVVSKNTATALGGGVYINGGSIAKTGGYVYGSPEGDKNTAGTGSGSGNALYAVPSTFKDDNLPADFTL